MEIQSIAEYFTWNSGLEHPKMAREIETLIDDVQHNCHIADARHGTDFGLCTYLMKMREYYRWEKGLGYTETLDKDEEGDWLSEREILWDELQGSEYRPLVVQGEACDPFDVERINRGLREYHLMYSGGLVQSGRAQFFLAELKDYELGDDGFELWVGQRELARGLYAPPAMTRGKTIYLRRESLKQFLWEKYESWLWSRPANAMQKALSCYPFEQDADLALEQMVRDEMQVIRAHEIGEYRAGGLLGPQWEEMLLAVLGTPAELMLRAVRDHLADCLETLPLLLQGDTQQASLHTYMGSLGNMRKAIFPSLFQAYERWLDGDGQTMLELSTRAAAHWQEVAETALEFYRESPGELAPRVARLVEENHL